MAKIDKLEKMIEGVKTLFYPLTIPQAVIDPETEKTQKEVNDSIQLLAAHGYGAEPQKTLKQVDDEIVQLAGDVSLLDAVQGAKIKDIENVLSTANLNQSAQLSVSGVSPLTLPKNAANSGMSVKLEGLTADVEGVITHFEPTGRVRSVDKNGLNPTALYLTAPELKSVQKARDEIRKGSNGYEHVKMILSKTLAADDIASLIAGTNIDLVTIPIGKFSNWHGAVATGTTGLASVLDNRFTKEAAASGYDIAVNAGSYSYGVVSFTLFFAKGTYADLAAAKAGLAGITINYKALTPVISPISYGGILNSAENGTVYHEPIIADAGVYDTNLPILLTDYPIATIEEIIKHENGVDTYLNVASAVVASDGLSFTHPNLASGDLVLFTYAYDKESTNGNITATFYDSNVVKIDTVTGKAYRINEVITNGVLTRTLTEV